MQSAHFYQHDRPMNQALCELGGDKYRARGLTYKIGLIVGGAWPVFHTPGLMGDGWGEPEQYFSLCSHSQAGVKAGKWELS